MERDKKDKRHDDHERFDDLPPVLEWSAPEYIHMEKGSDWYWAVGIVALAIIIAAILFNNIIFAIVILLASFTLTIYASRRPDTVNIRLDEKGVQVDDLRYEYKNLDTFGIDAEEHHPRLLLKSKKLFMPLISIPMGDMDPEVARDYLDEFLHEEDLAEPLLQKVLEYLGF